MKQIFIVLFLSFFCCAMAQQKTSQKQTFGYIIDQRTGEHLPGAFIICKSKKSSTISNGYGYYSIANVCVGDTIDVRFMGYEPEHKVVEQQSRLDIRMREKNENLHEVVVLSQSTFQRELQLTQMSHHHITPKDICNIPVIFGESDALKSIQYLPGINSAADGSTNISVRGGSYDQNLVMLDEATVYNPSHAMGIISAFNSDAISGVDLYKGDIPVRYGGKLSAVVDILMKEGNNNKWNVHGALGSIASRLMIEGPLKRNRASFMASGRFGYGDIVNSILDVIDYDFYHKNDVVRFYDLCAKVNWMGNENNKFYISGYASHDRFRSDILSQFNTQEWGNITSTIRWNHTYGNRMFSNATIYFSRYNYLQSYDFDVRSYNWKANMSEIGAKIDYDFYAKKIHLTYGFSIDAHTYKPGEIEPIGANSAMKAYSMEKKNMTTLALYVGNEHKMTDQLSLNYGLRLSALYTDYFNAEPRIALSYSTSDNVSFKVSYARTTQYQHLLNNSAVGQPTDIWLPATSKVKPQTADAYAVGVHLFWPYAKIETSIEGYYKKMHDIADFADNTNFILNEEIEDCILQGQSEAKGMEMMIRRNAQRTSIALSYTLSDVKRQIDGVNNDNWYYAIYDQRHNFNFNFMWRMSRGWTFNSTFRYHTGGRTTMPQAIFEYDNLSFSIYTERNNYKMPDFHQLDISFAYNIHDVQNRFQSEIIFSVYNVYGRSNPYALYVKPSDEGYLPYKCYKLFMYYVMPSLTYRFNF